MKNTMAMAKGGWYIALLVLLGACSAGSLEPTAYRSWVENAANGLKKVQTIGDYEFSLQYKPVDYVALVESRNPNITKQQVQQKQEELKDFQYYNLRIKTNVGTELLASNITQEDEYYGRLNYFVTYAQDDIQLYQGKDTIACGLYLFERNYGLAPYNNIVIGFKSNDTQTEKTIVFNDRVLGTGPVKFKIRKEDLANIPQLKTN